MKTKVAIFSVGFPVCSSRTLSGRPHYISAEYPHCFFQKLRRTQAEESEGTPCTARRALASSTWMLFPKDQSDSEPQDVLASI